MNDKKKMPIGRRFQKGQSGNPNGYKRPPALIALQKLTIQAYIEVIDLVFTGTMMDLKKLAKSSNSSAVTVGVAKSLLKAIKRGDFSVIDKIAERVIGKTSKQVNISRANIHMEHKTNTEILKRAFLELKKQGELNIK